MMPKDRLRQLTGEERLGQERESEYLGAEDIDDGGGAGADHLRAVERHG